MSTRIAYFCIESLGDYWLKPDKPIESCFFLKHEMTDEQYYQILNSTNQIEAYIDVFTKRLNEYCLKGPCDIFTGMKYAKLARTLRKFDRWSKKYKRYNISFKCIIRKTIEDVFVIHQT